MAEHKRRRGRPPGRQSKATLLSKIADEHVSIRDVEGAREVSVREAIILRLLFKAATGDIAIMRKLERFRAQLQPTVGITPGLLVVPGMMPADEWIAQQERLNTVRRPPEGLSAAVPPSSTSPARPSAPQPPRPPGPPHVPPRPARRQIIR